MKHDQGQQQLTIKKLVLPYSQEEQIIKKGRSVQYWRCLDTSFLKKLKSQEGGQKNQAESSRVNQ